MSDQSQGEGWWQASDGKWYPPHLHPSYRPPAAPQPAVTPRPARPSATAPPGAGSAPADGDEPRPAKPSPLGGRSRNQLILLGCAAVIGISCFLPWVKVQFFGSITASGIDGGDGWIFLAGAALIALLAWWREPGLPMLGLSILGIVGFIGERHDIGTVADDAGFVISIGTGLWLILAASLVAFGVTVHHLTSAPGGGLAAAPSDGFAPLARRYWWGLTILAVLAAGTIALGTEDHDDGEEVSTFGFDSSDENSSFDFGIETTTTERRAPVKLNVVEAGYSTYTDYDDSTAATAGAVITNAGKDDLAAVEVVFNFLGADKKPVGTESTTLPAIESGGTGYASVSSVSVTGPVASITVTTVPDDSAYADWEPTVLPVADVAVHRDQYSGFTVTGSATNSTSEVLESMSVDCVVRRNGAIVGGATGYLDTAPPGQTIAFEVRFGPDGVDIDGAECAVSNYD
jgi:hypothetical protein